MRIRRLQPPGFQIAGDPRAGEHFGEGSHLLVLREGTPRPWTADQKTNQPNLEPHVGLSRLPQENRPGQKRGALFGRVTPRLEGRARKTDRHRYGRGSDQEVTRHPLWREY